MSLWNVIPADKRKDVHWFFADDAGAEAFLKRWARKSREFQYVQKPAEEVWVDGGGAVSAEEPKVSWKAGGGRFGCFMRQVPFILKALDECPESELPGCIVFRGFLRIYIFSFQTRTECVTELRRILDREGQHIKDAECRHADLVASMPHAVYRGQCSCLSGKPYVECCGKKGNN
jgi:hypothetical protein